MKKEPPKPTKVVIPKTTTRSVKKYEPEFTKSVLDTPMNENLAQHSDIQMLTSLSSEK